MNLLIVDDQPSIVASLLTGIDWRNIGFENIYSATSALTAKEILKNNQVDILLTDIEMPVENGISLLTWVREQKLNMECVFLTSHPDFFYAKQAISLGAVDYVLQPAKNEDIIRAVENAKIRAMKNLRSVSLKTNKFTSIAQNTVIRDFFESWPNALHEENAEALDKKCAGLKEMGFSCEKDNDIFLMWLEIVRWSKIPTEAAEFIIAYQRILDDVLKFIRRDSISFYTDDCHISSIVFGALPENILPHIQIFQDTLSREIGIHTHILICRATVKTLKDGFDFLNNPQWRTSADMMSVPRENWSHILVMPKQDDIFSVCKGSESQRSYCHQIIEYIKENMDKQITRQHIADHLFLSPDYVNNIVKKCIGYSCTDLIIRVKMSHARKLLESTEMSVGEVAKETGYTSFAYFSKVYKDVYGETPSQSRHK